MLKTKQYQYIEKSKNHKMGKLKPLNYLYSGTTGKEKNSVYIVITMLKHNMNRDKPPTTLNGKQTLQQLTPKEKIESKIWTRAVKEKEKGKNLLKTYSKLLHLMFIRQNKENG